MLFNALSLMSVNAYLMPDENGEHLVYADTRILDPRYARSAEPLVCAHHEERFNPIISSGGGGGRGSGQVRQEEVQMIPIGCCPANDPTGKPYGAGKACCCGTVYNDDGNSICCEANCEVYSNTLQGITQCNLASINNDDHGDSDISEDEYTPQHTDIPDEGPPDYTPEFHDYSDGCAQGWYIPSPMTASCDNGANEGSFCSFSCPADLKVRIPDNPQRQCTDGEWTGDIPVCCEKDGCPDDLRVDFYFILDSSSSIKERNFHYIREYVSGLIATMPIGLDKTRVGIITYNSGVVERVRLDQYDDKQELIDAVMAIPYEGRGTRTNTALEYAVNEGIIESKGDRPDVPNFVLVLTDGRATDDVRVGAPALRNHAYVVAVGVGKKIKENELKIIAGSEDRVYMVTDFRSLGFGSLSQQREGEKVSEAEMQRRNKECMKKESMEAKGLTYVSDVQESAEVQAQRAVIQTLEDKFEAGEIEPNQFYLTMRGENIRLTKLIEADGSSPWSAESCVAIAKKENNKNGAVQQSDVARFTTSYICPKSCVFEQYTLFHP